MSRFATRAEVVAAADREGGNLAVVLDRGITADQMPDAELAAAWRELERAYKAAGDAEAAVYDLLPLRWKDGA